MAKVAAPYTITCRKCPAAEAMPELGALLICENTHRGNVRRVLIPAGLRPQHCYIVGATGTGEPMLLLSLILQDLDAGPGVGLLDPHGDLVWAILVRMPQHRWCGCSSTLAIENRSCKSS